MANNWIYWYGGECPVERGTFVDVIHRDGDKFYKQSAGIHWYEVENQDSDGSAHDWSHDNNDGDIIAYRLSEVEQ